MPRMLVQPQSWIDTFRRRQIPLLSNLAVLATRQSKIGAALAFDWDAESLRIVLGSVNANRLRVVRAERIGFDGEVDPNEAQQVGRFLRTALARRRLSVRWAIGCIDRRDAILHRLSVPPASADELPKIVHFQATTELLGSEQEATYDYLVTESGQDGSQVVVAVVPRQRVERIVEAARAAGLRLRAVRLQTLAWVAARQLCAPASPRPGGGSVEVLLAGGSQFVEAIGLRAGGYVASELVPVAGKCRDPATAARVALRRLNATLSAQWPGSTIAAYSACTPTSADWSGPVQAALHSRFVVFDPLSGLDGRVAASGWDRLASLAGALAHEATPPERAMDFLAPRRPRPPHPLRRHAPAIAAACAVCLLASYGLYVNHRLHLKDEELSRWRGEGRRIAAEYKKLKQYRAQHALVADWLDSRLDWLAEYNHVLRLLPDASQLYLTRVSFSQVRQRGLGTVRLEGYAASQSVVAETAQRLAADGHYRVRPSGIVPAGKASAYPWRFETELTILVPAEPPRHDDIAQR